MRDQSGIGVLRAVVLAFAICAPAGHPSMAGVCYDISKGEPTTLDGILRYEISAGPPNYEDVQMGDMPEPTHILALSQKICLTGDDSADPSLQFDEVQIVASNRDVGMRMRSLVGLPVATALYDPIAAITGHHHRPLVVWVSEIEAASDSSDETVAEYGTAATVVRAFYYALGEGNGEVAASFVLPANTHAGPLSAREISQFYGNLPEPLELLGLTSLARNAYKVHYLYRSTAARCDGRAIVHTQEEAGRFYISGIDAMDGC